MTISLCLGNLDKISRLESRSISAENPTGKKGMGGKVASKLGVGRKGKAFTRIKAGETQILAKIKGPGCIRHIWMTCRLRPRFFRGAIIRIYWDDRPYPSVECPLGDFFGVAHGRNEPYTSILTEMVEGRGMNMWIPMSFSDSARIEIENDSPVDSGGLFYQIDYTLGDDVRNTGRLCCTFRRENPTTLGKDFVILERVKGEGRFLGCVIGVRPLEEHWWGEGEVKIYLDGDEEFPTICGTGTEDYILSAHELGKHTNLTHGCPLYRKDLISFYRWHILDPIYFHEDIKVTMQQIGHRSIMPRGLFERCDDWSAAAFYYILDPKELPKIPNREERLVDVTEKRDGDPPIPSK